MIICKKNRLIGIVILFGFIISQSSIAQHPTETNTDNISQKWVDINYAGDTLTGHLLDIYLPAGGEAPYPVIVTIAGSAFFSDSSKHWAARLGWPLLDHGFAIVAVNHRSSRDAVFPAQMTLQKML